MSQASHHQVSYLFSLHLLLVIRFPISTCAKLVAILIIALVSYWTKYFFKILSELACHGIVEGILLAVLLVAKGEDKEFYIFFFEKDGGPIC